MSNRIKNLKSKILSENFFLLKEYIFNYTHDESHDTEEHIREVYDHGDGAGVLLYNKKKNTVVLTQQFRLPTYLNGDPSGMSIEICAGRLDDDTPEECAKREALEETGYQITKVYKAFEAFMSPGVMTEITHCFLAEYSEEMKIEKGGGLDEEQEHINILEIDFDASLLMISSGEIKDARTIMLLQYLKLNGVK